MANPSISNERSGGHPAIPEDAFALLGLSPHFDVDVAALERAYFENSKELHPDRFASAPAAERIVALTKSRALNDAYQTLKKPVPRAEYLLARAGITIGDNERLDPVELMPILEAREELQAAIHGKNLPEVERMCALMKVARDRELERLREAFGNVEYGERAGIPTDQYLAIIKKILILMRYTDRYLEACEGALDED